MKAERNNFWINVYIVIALVAVLWVSFLLQHFDGSMDQVVTTLLSSLRMGGSVALTLIGNAVLIPVVFPIATKIGIHPIHFDIVQTAAVGIGKELWDRERHADFSLRDLAWDAIGAASGAVLMRQFDR